MTATTLPHTPDLSHPPQVATTQSPGASNTRALTPPTAAFPEENANPPVPLLLQSGADWLQLACRVDVPHFRLVQLDRALGSADQPGSFQLARTLFQLSRVGSRGKLKLSNHDLALVVGPDPAGFHVAVALRALRLRTTPLAHAIDSALALVTDLAGAAPTEARVRRLDLFADATGLDFSRADEDCFVARSRRLTRFHAIERVFARKRGQQLCCTGFVFAPGNPLLVRIYDKTEELFSVHGHDSEKTRTELAAYRASGWDGQSLVWRVEAQLRTEVLQRLGVDSPQDLRSRLDSLWHYVVGEPGADGDNPHRRRRGWLRHVRRGSATPAERCPTSEKWRVFQQARFAGRQPLQRRDGHQGGAPLPLSVGMLHSTLSSTASLPALAGEGGKIDDIIRADAARFAERVIADQRLRRDYLRKRDAARGRFARWG